MTLLAQMTPDDVYPQVMQTQRMITEGMALLHVLIFWVKALCVLVVGQCALKLFESWRLRLVGTRVEKHLDWIALHGQLTDRRTSEMKTTVEEVKGTIAQAAAKVVEDIRQGSGPQAVVAVVPVPGGRREYDPKALPAEQPPAFARATPPGTD